MGRANPLHTGMTPRMRDAQCRREGGREVTGGHPDRHGEDEVPAVTRTSQDQAGEVEVRPGPGDTESAGAGRRIPELSRTARET